MSRFRAALAGFTGFIASALAISLFRYWFVFRQFCGIESGVPNGSQSLMGCPDFLEILLITSISPGFFLVSVLVGLVSVYIYSRKGQ